MKKKDGKLRFCVDYKTLNSITEKDVYPLPRIDDSLAMLKKGKFLLHLIYLQDIGKNHLHQIPRQKQLL